jgi:hypothetical protein
MKIRIKGNSLRYRLTKTDVVKFSEKGYLEETITFGEQSLIYALKSAPITHLRADFDNSKITLLMPDPMVEEWTTTDRVGFENSNGPLYLLIEKDFKCLDNVMEDQSDNYPNPLSQK